MKQPKFKFGDKLVLPPNRRGPPHNSLHYFEVFEIRYNDFHKDYMYFGIDKRDYIYETMSEEAAELYVKPKKMVTKYLWAIKADKNIWSNLSEFCETELEFRDRYDLGYDLEVKRLDFSATEFEVED